MKFYYVYMLRCSDNSIYTRITNAIDRRLNGHLLGFNKDCYTFNRRPLVLIFHQEFMQFEQAELFEERIKKWSRQKKWALANDNYNLLKALLVCSNKTNSKNYNM